MSRSQGWLILMVLWLIFAQIMASAGQTDASAICVFVGFFALGRALTTLGRR